MKSTAREMKKLLLIMLYFAILVFGSYFMMRLLSPF